LPFHRQYFQKLFFYSEVAKHHSHHDCQLCSVSYICRLIELQREPVTQFQITLQLSLHVTWNCLYPTRNCVGR
jgi:hypothetical protein